MFLPRDHDLNKPNSTPSGDASTYVSTFLLKWFSRRKFWKIFHLKVLCGPSLPLGIIIKQTWIYTTEEASTYISTLLAYDGFWVEDFWKKKNYDNEQFWSVKVTSAIGSGELKVDGPISFNRYFSLRCKLTKNSSFPSTSHYVASHLIILLLVCLLIGH